MTEIPVEAQKDGTMKSLDHQYDEYVKEVNEVTKLVTDCLNPVVDFIKKEIFTTGKIMAVFAKSAKTAIMNEQIPK